MSCRFVRRACIRAFMCPCVRELFIVSEIENTFHNQTGPNLHEVFMGMSSIVSDLL